MTSPTDAVRSRRLLSASTLGALRPFVVVAVATMVVNAASYAMSLAGARLLAPDQFGAFGALLALSIIASTVSISVQALGARRSADTVSAPAEGRDVASTSVAAALVVTVVAALASPVLAVPLSVPAWAVACAFASVAVSVVGFGALGLLQGAQSYGRFGSAYGFAGLARAAGTVVAIVIVPTATSAVVGMLAGTVVGTVGALGMARMRPVVRRPPRGTVHELVRNTGSMLGLYTFINVDIVLGRAYLEPSTAGSYAAGSLVSKVAFFLPAFIGIVLFPLMASADGRRARLLNFVGTAAVGALFTMAVALRPMAVLDLVGGARYLDISGSLWIFALQGSVFAVAQAVVLARLSGPGPGASWAVWTTTAAFVLLVSLRAHESVAQIVTLSLVLAVALVAWVALTDRRRARLAAQSSVGAGSPAR